MSKLFESSTINGMMVKNRFVRSATYEALASGDGSCTPALTGVMQNLASGGVGLIITGGAYVLPEGRFSNAQVGADRDALVPGLKHMTAAVHGAGSKIALQLVHTGCLASPEVIGTMPLGPTIRGEGEELICREMNRTDIRTVISAFGAAAGRAKDAGFDAVQIHAAHGALLTQFLSPYFNKRTDEYGGDIEHRARIVLEILETIRDSVGKNYPVLIKINSEDFLEGGAGVEDMIKIAGMIEHAGVDAIELSGGTYFPSGKFSPNRPGRIVPDDEGYHCLASQRFKKEITIPLMLVGGIRSVSVAGRFINEGIADYISLCRPLISEPDLVNRWKSGDERPSRCVSDNQCLSALGDGKGLRCVTFGKIRKP